MEDVVLTQVKGWLPEIRIFFLFFLEKDTIHIAKMSLAKAAQMFGIL